MRPARVLLYQLHLVDPLYMHHYTMSRTNVQINHIAHQVQSRARLTMAAINNIT